MKKWLIPLIFLCAIGAALLQTPWMQAKEKALLQNALRESGIQAGIERMEGNRIVLKNIQIEVEGYRIFCETLDMRLSLWRLLKREILLSDLKGDLISWEKRANAPSRKEETATDGRTWTESFRYGLRIQHFSLTRVEIPDLFFTHFEGKARSSKKFRRMFLDVAASRDDFPEITAHLRFSSQSYKMAAAKLTFKAPSLELAMAVEGSRNAFFHPEEPLHIRFQGAYQFPEEAKLTFSGYALRSEGSTWTIDPLSLRGEGIALEAHAKTIYAQKTLHAQLAVQGKAFQEHWEGTAEIEGVWGGSLFVRSFKFASPSIEMQGDLEWRSDHLLSGVATLRANQIHPLLPSMFGQVNLRCILFPTEKKEQGLRCDAEGVGIYWNELYTQKAFAYFDLTNPWHRFEGTAFLNFEQMKWKTLDLEKLTLKTASAPDNWPFQVFAEGMWRHPLTLQLDGFWKYKDPELLLSLQNGSGSFFNLPLEINEPTSLEYSPSRLKLQGFRLLLGEGQIELSLQREKDRSDGSLTLANLPLNILSLNPLAVPVEGMLSGHATFEEKDDRLVGGFQLQMEKLELENLTGARATLKGSYEKDRLDLQGTLALHEAPWAMFDFSLPLHAEVFPFHATLLLDERTKGHLTWEGQVADVFDFVDLGSHHLEGHLKVDLTFSHTLAELKTHGTIDFTNGYYQNYSTGTELTQIQATWRAERDRLILHSFEAKGTRGQGSVTAVGETSLSLSEMFPYRFDVKLSRFATSAFDSITSEVTGKLKLDGNLKEGLAQGTLELVETEISIPDRLPRKYPDLQVVYKNPIKPIATPSTSLSTLPYPLHLDINLDGSEGIFIAGRGLSSEWAGNIHLGGTLSAMAPQGKFEMTRGEFVFSGRKFNLTRGSLSFSGQENEIPYLDLIGTIDIKDVTILAELKGPLNHPQITFQSTPPLPLAMVVSYLLFGQEMSEINSFQALQLANSIASLFGEGPNVLEATRKSLGVDRLEIVSAPAAEGETIALQVGKYVAEGVLVTFSQGAEDATSNIRIEVDVKQGWALVFESQQPQAQGKFTLKWSRNY